MNDQQHQNEAAGGGSALTAELGAADCEYCGGNDETPPDHCMDCARPNQQHYPEEWGPSNARRLTCVCGDPDPFHATKVPNAPELTRAEGVGVE